MARTRKRFWAWTLTLTAALLAVVWVGSMKVRLRAQVPPNIRIAIAAGRFFVQQEDLIGFRFSQVSATIEVDPRWRARWWFAHEVMRSAVGTQTLWSIPLWPFVLLTGVPGVWMLIKTRKHANPNACPACGYDRTGLPPTPTGPAPCPECGKGAGSL